MKDLSLITALLLIVLYLAIPHQQAIQMALSPSSPIWTRLTYMMLHDNPFHLAVNLYSLLTLAFLPQTRLHHAIAAVLISATLPLALTGGTPILGISVLNYALVGMLICFSHQMRFLLLINLAIIAAGCIAPHIAVLPHLFGFILGYTYGLFTTPRYAD